MDASEIWLFSAETKRKVGKCVGALPMGTEKRRKNSIHGTQSNNITRSVGAAGSNVRKAGIKISSSFKAFGKEHLYTSDGGVVEFRTRTSSGGLGEGYDVLIIDEAQEYTEAQETSLKYIVSDSENPQTIMLGTPPTAVSAGTVFTKYRETVLAGRGFDSGWAEWSVENLTSANDVEAWYETNPSLGTILTERKIRAEITTDDIDFNIQRLGLWLKYNQKSAISKTEWESLAIASKPKLKGELFVGVKYGHDGQHVAMSVASKTNEGKIFVEALDCRTIRERERLDTIIHCGNETQNGSCRRSERAAYTRKRHERCKNESTNPANCKRNYRSKRDF